MQLNIAPSTRLVIGQPQTQSQVPGYIGMTAADYKKYDQRTHVYMKPDTYVGSEMKVQRQEWLFNAQEKRIYEATIDYVPACERLYLEILTNASDNVGRSRRAGVDPDKIEILMDNNTISITNYGLPIPIEVHPEEKIYIPQMILGTLLTSSNYEVDRHEAGTNGYGGKITNIFSKKFAVIIYDHYRGLKYTQVWNENMTVCSQPQIEEYKGKKSSVQVIYEMDFARFRYPVPALAPDGTNVGGYPPEAFALFARHAIDISFTAKAIVTFNGEVYDYRNIRDYARCYFGDAVKNAVVHYQWPAGTEIIKKKKGYQVSKDPSVTPEVEFIAIDTPDEGHHISFVNCMMTRDGGVHVNATVKAVGDSAVHLINDAVIKKLTKQNKGKELDAKTKRSQTININDVKPHISILLSVKLVNPTFTGQTKSALGAPVPKITISDDELKPVQRWQLIDRLFAALEAKQFATLSKNNGKLKRYLKLRKGIDANEAGKKKRHQCVLYITEGKSGIGYVNDLIELIATKRDFIGVYPAKGKGLNVMNAGSYQIGENDEIAELMKLLGLEFCPVGADKNTYYLDPVNFNKLRYGALMIMADSDVDGKHIIGLILNLFYCFFPSLLARGYVMFYRTPILRVTFNRQTLKFYTHQEYLNWVDVTPNYQSWTHKYYKGLGSSRKAEVKDDFTTPRIVHCVYDDAAPDAMRLAFDKKLADRRKDWVGGWRHVLGVDDIQMQPISWFINHELILFSIADTKRSLPKLVDGFKESHRKIIKGAHLKWKISPSKAKYKEVKVAQMGGFVTGETNYQHGEAILSDVLVGMAQDFVGANNIPWFTKDGQLGSRMELGKDASQSRYTFVRPVKLFPYIIRCEDAPILTPVIDEGMKVEPETYYPVIPMILVNGSQGIGTGYSTFVPCHDPLDLINWLRLKLTGTEDQELPNIIPWYRGFTGEIRVIDRRNRRKKSDQVNVTIINHVNENGISVPVLQQVLEVDTHDTTDEILPGEMGYDEQEDEDQQRDTPGSRPLLSMISLGKFHMNNLGTIIIDELPIGRSTLSYHKWLEDLVQKKKITGFRDQSVNDIISLEIYGFKDQPTCRTLKLQRTYGMSNMYLLDDNSRPIRYDTSYDILEAFYSRRLPIYQRRKEYEIGKIVKDILKNSYKIQFIQAVLNKQIRFIGKSKTTIYESMDVLGIPRKIFDKSMNHHLTEDDIAALYAANRVKEEQRAILDQTTPEQMWIKDLDDLEKVYRTVFKVPKPAQRLTILR